MKSDVENNPRKSNLIFVKILLVIFALYLLVEMFVGLLILAMMVAAMIMLFSQGAATGFLMAIPAALFKMLSSPFKGQFNPNKNDTPVISFRLETGNNEEFSFQGVGLDPHVIKKGDKVEILGRKRFGGSYSVWQVRVPQTSSSYLAISAAKMVNETAKFLLMFIAFRLLVALML